MPDELLPRPVDELDDTLIQLPDCAVWICYDENIPHVGENTVEQIPGYGGCRQFAAHAIEAVCEIAHLIP